MGIGTLKSSSWMEPLGEWGRYATEEIFQTYGHTVKPTWRNIRKFGATEIPTKNVQYSIMSQGSTAINHEALSTSNKIDSIVADETGNTQVISISGHTISTAGNLTGVSQEATLSGTTAVSLGTPLARVNRMYVKDGTFKAPSAPLSSTASVYAYASTDTGITAGVPSSSSAVHCIIPPGANQTRKAQTSVAHNEYFALMGVTGALPERNGNVSNAVDINLQVRHSGGVFRETGVELSVGQGSRTDSVTFGPPIIVPPNSDVRLVAVGSTSGMPVNAAFYGVLVGWSPGDAT